MADTKISWTEAVWNPVTGCDRVSPGCDHCYALTMARRLKAMRSPKYQRDGDPRTSGPGFGVTVHHGVVAQPLSWRRSRHVFVNSMSDLFHAEVPTPWLADIFAVMAATPQHTYQVLTKRHGRMKTLLNDPVFAEAVLDRALGKGMPRDDWTWPLPNLWLGVSAEDQPRADLRIPILLETPAAVRWVSIEPMLGEVDLSAWINTEGALVCGCGAAPPGSPGYGGGCSPSCMWPWPSDLDWVVIGGESGPGARPMDLDAAARLVAQCQQAGVPVFVKQLGSAWAKDTYACGRSVAGLGDTKGTNMLHWPAALRSANIPPPTDPEEPR